MTSRQPRCGWRRSSRLIHRRWVLAGVCLRSRLARAAKPAAARARRRLLRLGTRDRVANLGIARNRRCEFVDFAAIPFGLLVLVAEQRPLRKPVPHRLRSARTPLQPVRTLRERITIFQLAGRDPHAFSAAGLCRAVRRRAREARRCGACDRPHSRDLRDLFSLHALR